MLLLGGKPGLLDPAQDQRSGMRRKLRLEASGSTAADKATQVLIHDLSQTGILIQTEAQLSAGEAIQVELPYGGAWDATVVWSSDGLFGCEFERPIPKAAISAALLKAPVYGSAGDDTDPPAREQSYALNVSEGDANKLSPRTRAITIVSLGVLTWTPIVAGVAQLVS